MFIAQLAKRVGRSVDTIKRWEDQGLLNPSRDEQERRVYDEKHVTICLELAKLGVTARRRSQKLSHLVATMPQQLALLEDRRLVGSSVE